MDERTPLMRLFRSPVARRVLLVPVVFGVAAGAVAALPVLLTVALVADLVRARWRWPTARAALAVVFYAVAEAAGLLGAGWVWLRFGWRPAAAERFLEANHAVARRWARGVLTACFRLYGMKLQVEGREHLSPGPILLLCRHASLVDTLLPLVLLGPLGARPRYVMKALLRLDPMMDVLSGRSPNALVDRFSQDSAAEVEKVAALGDGLGPRDAVALFPEGTRATAAKRARVLRKLARMGDPVRLARAQELTHTLPPRAGGALALLDRAAGVDVVFCAHTGFESLTELDDLLRGTMVGQRVQVTLWRMPAAEIPDGRDARLAWLHENWVRVDAWVGAHGAP
jgi:1-acyl-sn-glycerol-3-phosphate acyltransferase